MHAPLHRCSARVPHGPSRATDDGRSSPCLSSPRRRGHPGRRARAVISCARPLAEPLVLEPLLALWRERRDPTVGRIDDQSGAPIAHRSGSPIPVVPVADPLFGRRRFVGGRFLGGQCLFSGELPRALQGGDRAVVPDASQVRRPPGAQGVRGTSESPAVCAAASDGISNKKPTRHIRRIDAPLLLLIVRVRRERTVVSLGVEAPGRPGARSAHTGSMYATSNVVGRDASAARITLLFLADPKRDGGVRFD